MQQVFYSLPPNGRLAKLYVGVCIALMIFVGWLTLIVVNINLDAYFLHRAYLNDSVIVQVKIVGFTQRKFPGRAASALNGAYPDVYIPVGDELRRVILGNAGPVALDAQKDVLGRFVSIVYIKGRPETAVPVNQVPAAFDFMAVLLLICCLAALLVIAYLVYWFSLGRGLMRPK